MARTLLDIKTEVATYFQKSVSDFTINGQDLFLMAANHVRSQAELAHDFEFLRKLADVTVSGSTGGSLATATDHVTSAAVTVKTVVEMGIYDQFGNLRPVHWEPVANALEKQRQQNPMFFGPRYPADGEVQTWPRGYGEFRLSNDSIFKFPKMDTASSESYAVGIECYSISADWTAGDLAVPTLTVTGTLTPDATGVYTYVGEVDGAAFFVDPTFTYYIGRITVSSDFWQIASFINGLIGAVWGGNSSSADDPAGTGTFMPDNGAVGTATVVAASGASDTWTTYGGQYLLWAIIVYINHRFKTFVFRTEGNLPPPQQLRDEALAAFIEWDTDRYTKFRRETR